MKADLTPRRLFVCAAALMAIVVTTSGCGGGTNARAAGKTDPQLVTYSSPVLSFSHPATWKAYPYTGGGELHFHPLVYLSTQAVHDPCSTQGTMISCGFPVKRLAPGGVLAFWQTRETPVTGPVEPSGTRIQVGDHPAVRQETAQGECKSIGADRTIRVVSEVSRQNLTLFTACLRRPGLARAEKQVNAVLASTKFGSGSG